MQTLAQQVDAAITLAKSKGMTPEYIHVHAKITLQSAELIMHGEYTECRFVTIDRFCRLVNGTTPTLF